MTMLFSTPLAKAQVSININLNSQPAWGPVGYNHVEYYYLPDIEMYYYVPSAQFVYYDGHHWIWVSSLPHWCRNYNLYSGYKVVVNEPKPYMYFHTHKVKYAKYKNCHGQQKYKGGGNGNHGKGHGNGQGKGNGHKKGHGKGH